MANRNHVPKPGDRVRLAVPLPSGDSDGFARFGTVVERSSGRSRTLRVRWDPAGPLNTVSEAWLADSTWHWDRGHLTLAPADGRRRDARSRRGGGAPAPSRVHQMSPPAGEPATSAAQVTGRPAGEEFVPAAAAAGPQVPAGRAPGLEVTPQPVPDEPVRPPGPMAVSPDVDDDWAGALRCALGITAPMAPGAPSTSAPGASSRRRPVRR